MENRVAIIGIFVEDNRQSARINDILHEYNSYVVGRMGVPYKQRQIGVISVIVDAPNAVISAMSGKLGRIEGVHTKTMYSKETIKTENGNE